MSTESRKEPGREEATKGTSKGGTGMQIGKEYVTAELFKMVRQQRRLTDGIHEPFLHRFSRRLDFHEHVEFLQLVRPCSRHFHPPEVIECGEAVWFR